VSWYNHEHLHSSIRFVTPADRHDGKETAILQAREEVYARAQRRNPERWKNSVRNWTPISEVTLNPSPTMEVQAGG